MSNFVHPYTITALLVLIFSVVLYETTLERNVLKSEIAIIAQNNRALLSDIETYKTTAQEEGQQRLALLGDIAELESVNRALAEQARREGDRVQALTIINQELRGQLGETEVIVEPQDSLTWSEEFTQFNLAWQDTSKWHRLSGYFIVELKNDSLASARHFLTENTHRLPLLTGYRQTDEGWFIFARSQNPYVEIVGLEGFIPRPQPKPTRPRYVIGPTLGVGAGNQGFTPFIGVGVTYNLIQF